jgi:hypothetical protein
MRTPTVSPLLSCPTAQVPNGPLLLNGGLTRGPRTMN